MRIRYLFLILFVGIVWCGSDPSDPRQLVVIDTNAWSEPLNLFDYIIKENQRLNPSEPKWDYHDLWKKFESSESVDSFLKGFLNDKKTSDFSRGILFVKRILDLKTNRPQVEIDVPIFVFNELTKSLTSKIASESSSGGTLNYEEFFAAMPIETHVGKGEVVEGVDYPKKRVGAPAKDLKQAMTDFFESNGIGGDPTIEGKHQLLNELIHQLGQEVESKKKETRKRLDDLRKLSENVRDKKQIWDDDLKGILSFLDEFKGFTTETGRLYPVATKIIEYADSMKKLKYTSPRDMVIDRLLKSKEEFDIFDLKIYLYAKEKGAHIMTFNTQAFQEINDPTFLNFFKETQILQPEINFKTSTDLDHSFCEQVLESSIQNDFNRENGILSSLEEVKTLRQNKIDVSEFRELFSQIIRECSESTKGNFKSALTERPILKMLNLLVKVDGKWKIDQQVAFNTENVRDIGENVNILKFFEKYVLKRELTIDDFHHGPIVIDSVPKLLKNKQLVEALKEARKDGSGALKNFLDKFKSGNKNDINDCAKVMSIISTYKPESIDKAIENFGMDARKIPTAKCPPGGSRRRRSIEPCSLSWDDIDRFNEEHEFRRDAEKVKIDSKNFIEYLESVEDPLKRQQLCQFVEQIIETTEASETKIVGESVPEVNRIINRNKIIDHFSKVGQVSGALNTGVLAKNILADFLSGDIEDVAVNVGFLAGDHALAKLAGLAEVKGAAFVTSGKLMLGNTFKIASPFIKRLSSAFVVYDLVEQIKALERGDKDAIIRVVGDGVILGVDAVETGIAIAEVAGAISGASAVTGPIGLAITAIVLVGTEVYFAVRHVEDLDKVLHLSLDEKIVEGLNSVFHAPSAYLEELKEVKLGNNQLTKDAMEFLKKQEHIQKFVFPSARYNYKEKKVDVADSVQIRLAENPSTIRWDRSRPDDPAGGKVFCATQSDEIGEVPPAGTTHTCVDAIGIADLTPKTDPCVLFNLNQTNSVVDGFQDYSNVFITSGLGSRLTGGNLNDIFSIKTNKETSTEVDGLNGDNTLDLSDMDIDGPLEINFESGICKLPCSVILRNINRFIARKQKKDVVTANCSTTYISTQGGMPIRPDQINIAAKYCRYNLSMKLDSHTVVRNEAIVGDFTYFIEKDQESVSVIAPPPRERHRNFLNTTHTFFINYDLLDLEAIEDQTDANRVFKLIFGFRNRETNTLIPVSISLNNKNGIIILKDLFAIKLHTNGLYGMQKTNKSSSEIIEKYPAFVNRLGITLYVQASDGTVIVDSGKTKENVFHNDPEQDTIIIANHADTNNAFIIDYENNSHLPQVTIFAGDNQNNTLDLHAVAQGIRKLHGNDCLLLHSVNLETKILKIDLIEGSTLATLTTVTVKNFNNNCDQWHVILNNAPVLLKCDEEHLEKNQNRQQILDDYVDSDHYTPLPLVFNATEIIVITPSDIEPNADIVVLEDIGEYVFTRFDDGLLITNIIPHANSTTFIRKSCSVLLKGFDDRLDIFASITLKFNDKTIELYELRDDIETAVEFNDWLNEFHGDKKDADEDQSKDLLKKGKFYYYTLKRD